MSSRVEKIKAKSDEKVSKVRTHFQENGKVYAGIGAGLVAGVGLGAGALYGLNARAGNSVSLKQILAWKSEMTAQIVQINLPRAGHAGTVWVDKETGEWFMSSNKLLEAIGASRANLKRYLDGEIPDLAGRQFKLIVDGAPPLEVSQLIGQK